MFDVDEVGRCVVVTPRCDLDIVTRDEFKSVLATAGLTPTTRIVISLEHCAYLDSSALGAIAHARTSLGDRLAIVVPSDSQISRVFEITEFKKVVPIFSILDDALAAG